MSDRFQVHPAAIRDGDAVIADVTSLDEDLRAKREAKYDVNKEHEAGEWIRAIVGETVFQGNFAEALKSGVILCKLLNKIHPGAIPKVYEGGIAFKQRENIALFLRAIQNPDSFGVHNTQVFQPDDLYEQKNMGSVVNCIFALGGAAQRVAPGLKPTLGIMDSSSVRRTTRRNVDPPNQLTGLQQTMERTELDVSKQIGADPVRR